MPQSLASIPLHCIWSTRDRQPLIKPEIEKELFSYMPPSFAKMNLRRWQSTGPKIMFTVL